ncbi:MAG: acyl-CoA dehydrogenase [bacterium]|nr:acyl-CoA dehydrogenase [Deltaproteobacteria bacterium]MCP4907160.1 acyl-CoA dehydrogenase [bacterium]
MDLEYGPEYDVFRQEVEQFLAETPEDIERRSFLLAATERGYLYRHIPKRFGGAEEPFDPIRETIVSELFDASPFSWRLGPQSTGMIVPTLLEAGADWQREQFIPPTLLGDAIWCQGYSEPGAGSDLASLRATAHLDGEEWVINGQKIWTSDAEDAGFMFGMFRTEPEADKHAGISYLLLEMNQPGLDVRPLRQITGATHFYEVFFDDVRTPAHWIVGERGEGWRVARANLKHERNLGGGPRLRQRFRALLSLAQSTLRNGQPASQDPLVRQRLAEIEGEVRCAETMTLRRLSAAARGEDGLVVLPLLVNKLYGTEIGEQIAQLGFDLIGDDGLLAPTRSTWNTVSTSAEETDWVDQYLFELASGIAAGSSNIQRNVIGERGLGLPRDLRTGGPA